MNQSAIQIKKRSEQEPASIEESEEITALCKKHKRWLLKSKHHYTSLNYSKFISSEILRQDRKLSDNEKIFLNHKVLTRETLSGIINLNLKSPIEAYVTLKDPLTVEDMSRDMERLGDSFFRGSIVDFCKIKTKLKQYLNTFHQKQVILNQLTILKAENPEKYTDMLRTGFLNYVIESRFTEENDVLKESFLAGILHDIGFLYLHPRNTGRNGSVVSISELKNRQNHTHLGYYILKPWFSENITNAAMMHHVGEDQSGYPRQTAITPNRMAKLTGFVSAFVTGLRKHKLNKALKIQEIYSRAYSYDGESLKPVFKREFFNALKSLEISFNNLEKEMLLDFKKKHTVILHNFLVYIDDLGQELDKIDTLLLNYIREKASHHLDLQSDIDDIFDHIKRLNVIIKSCGKSPGLRRIMNDNQLASSILGDIEIISLELHRNNRLLIGLFNYLNTKLNEPDFKATIYKTALSFSQNIKRNISDHLEKEINVFDILYAVSG